MLLGLADSSVVETRAGIRIVTCYVAVWPNVRAIMRPVTEQNRGRCLGNYADLAHRNARPMLYGKCSRGNGRYNGAHRPLNFIAVP